MTMRIQLSNSVRRQDAAFTLIELLVAVSVLSILILLLAQVSNTVANTWSSGNARADRRQNGRSLVDFIARELRGATLPVAAPKNASGDIINIPDLNFVQNPDSVGDNYKYPHCIFWQAPIANNLTQGDLAVIGYFIRWDTSGSTPKALLCRLFINPNDPNYSIYNTQEDWINSDLLDAAAPANNQKPVGGAPNAYRGLFAENVVAFWAQCIDAAGNKIDGNTANATVTETKSFDSRQDYTGADAQGQSKSYNAPTLPHSVEVSFILLDSQTASLLTNTTADTLKQIARVSASPEAYLTSLRANGSLKRIAMGATAHKLQVYLDNAP